MIFDLGSFAFSCTYLTFHLISSSWDLEIFRTASPFGISHPNIDLYSVLFLQKKLSWRLLMLMTAFIDRCWTLWFMLFSLNLFSFCIWRALTVSNFYLYELFRSCWIRFLSFSGVILFWNVMILLEKSSFIRCFIHQLWWILSQTRVCPALSPGIDWQLQCQAWLNYLKISVSAQ